MLCIVPSGWNTEQVGLWTKLHVFVHSQWKTHFSCVLVSCVLYQRGVQSVCCTTWSPAALIIPHQYHAELLSTECVCEENCHLSSSVNLSDCKLLALVVVSRADLLVWLWSGPSILHKQSCWEICEVTRHINGDSSDSLQDEWRGWRSNVTCSDEWRNYLH